MRGNFRRGLNTEAVPFSTRLAVQPSLPYKSNTVGKMQDGSLYDGMKLSVWMTWTHLGGCHRLLVTQSRCLYRPVIEHCSKVNNGKFSSDEFFMVNHIKISRYFTGHF